MHTPRSREICMHKLVSRRVGCAHASFQARTDGWTLAYYGSYWLPNLACMDVITSNQGLIESCADGVRDVASVEVSVSKDA